MALFIKKRPLGWCQKGSPSVDGNGQTSLSVSNCVKLCQKSHIDSFLTQFLRILESVDWLHRNRHISYTFFWIFRVSWLITQKSTHFWHIFLNSYTWFDTSLTHFHLIPDVNWLITQKLTHSLHIFPNFWSQLTDDTEIDTFLTHFWKSWSPPHKFKGCQNV